MVSYTLRQSIFLHSMIFCSAIANARHIHHHNSRHIHPLAASMIAPLPVLASSSSTKLTSDLTSIEQSLESLPEDVLTYLQYLETKLQRLQTLLSRCSGSTPSASTIQTVSSLLTCHHSKPSFLGSYPAIRFLLWGGHSAFSLMVQPSWRTGSTFMSPLKLVRKLPTTAPRIRQ
jgi:hypothetical protein